MIRYTGRLRFIAAAESVAFIAPTFETGDKRYAWINDIQAFGRGIFSADLTELRYEIYEPQ